MELLQDGKKGDATKLVTLAENIAKKSESEHDWHRARSYWEGKNSGENGNER